MPIFKQVTDENGEVTYVEAELTVDDLTPELVKQHPLHKDVLAETISRRQTIQDLKAQIAALDDGDKPREGSQTPNPKETPMPAAPSIDVEQLKDEILNRVKSEQTNAQQRQAQLKEIATKHNLSDEVVPLLADAQDPEKLAAFLGRQQTQLSEAKASNPQTDTVESFAARVEKLLGFND